MIPRLRFAASGRPPVLIDIPKDVQMQAIEITAWPAPARTNRTGSGCLAERGKRHDQRGQAADSFILGGGVVPARPRAGRRTGREGRPADRDDADGARRHAGRPSAVARHARHARRPLHQPGADECDLLIAVGARFDDRATGKVAAFCPQARIIHIDIDPAELDKIKTAHIGITADVQEALTACCRRGRQRTQRLAAARRYAESRTSSTCRMSDRPLSHFGLIRTVADIA